MKNVIVSGFRLRELKNLVNREGNGAKQFSNAALGTAVIIIDFPSTERIYNFSPTHLAPEETATAGKTLLCENFRKKL